MIIFKSYKNELKDELKCKISLFILSQEFTSNSEALDNEIVIKIIKKYKRYVIYLHHIQKV